MTTAATTTIQEQIEELRGMPVSRLRERYGDRELTFSELVRSLEPGQVILAASHAQASERVSRIVVARIRPRVTVHGGEVA